MTEIEMYPGVNIEYAYEELKKFKQETGENCLCKFNDMELHSSETLDSIRICRMSITNIYEGKLSTKPKSRNWQ